MAIQIYGDSDTILCSVKSGETNLTRENAEAEIKWPVQQTGKVSEGGVPEVEVLQGEPTATDREPPFGIFWIGPNAKGNVGILRDFDRVKVRRKADADAITADEVGRKVKCSNTAGEDGFVVVGADKNLSSPEERWVITGGNITDGSTENPAFFTVSSTQ